MNQKAHVPGRDSRRNRAEIPGVPYGHYQCGPKESIFSFDRINVDLSGKDNIMALFSKGLLLH
jgi:hypothetical protein